MLLFLFYVAGYLAGAACLLEAFEIPVRGAGFFAALAIFALLFFILYWLRKWARYTIPLTAVAFGLLAFRFSGRIAQGGVAFLRTVNRVVLLYTGASDRSIEHSPETLASLEIFLLFVLFLLGSLLFCGIYVKRGKWVPIFYSICVIGISLAVGKVPGILLTCLLAFSCLGEVAASGVRQPSIRRKVLLLTGVAALICLLLGQHVALPLLQPAFAKREEVKEQIQNTSMLKELLANLPDITGGWLNRGGLGEGDLTGGDGFLFTGKTALTVRTQQRPEETMYLKGYVGTEYTGNRWNEVEDLNWEEKKNQVYQSLRSLPGVYQEEPETVEMQIDGANADYSYEPYYSILEEQADENVYRYEWLSRQQVTFGLSASSFFIFESPYQEMEDFVPFLTYPQGLTQLAGLVQEHPAGYDEDSIVNTVVGILGEMASYSLDVGRFPEGEDVAEYFLFQEKEGYCIHFATAAVLMLRMYGIPARYVEGYIVPSEDFVKEGDGYVAEVSDERAHAWAEIYRSDRGWTPVEATPGFAEDASEGETETETQPQSQSQSESQTAQTETETVQEENTALGGTEIVRILLLALLLLILLFAAIMLTLRLRFDYIRRKRQAMGAAQLFPILYRALLLGGWSESADCQDGDFPEKVTEEFPWIETEQMREVMDIVMRANFGPGPVTEEEDKKVRSMYQHICRRICSGWPLPKRVWMRYVRVI